MSDASAGPRRWVAPGADLACIVSFILVGAGRHDITEGIGWFLTVLWPISVGWYSSALATSLYTRQDRWILRLLATIGVATVVMCVLRGAFTDRPWVSVFAVVFILWMLLTAFGWRALARVVPRWFRRAPATDGALSGDSR